MAKAKISPRQKAGSNRGSHILKATKPGNQGSKGIPPAYKTQSKTPVLLTKPISQVSLVKKHK